MVARWRGARGSDTSTMWWPLSETLMPDIHRRAFDPDWPPAGTVEVTIRLVLEQDRHALRTPCWQQNRLSPPRTFAAPQAERRSAQTDDLVGFVRPISCKIELLSVGSSLATKQKHRILVRAVDVLEHDPPGPPMCRTPSSRSAGIDNRMTPALEGRHQQGWRSGARGACASPAAASARRR